MNEHAQRQAERAEKLRAAAARALEQAQAREEGAAGILRRIPAGQPILIGHNSERRHRKDLDRIDAGFRAGQELRAKAERLQARADGTGGAGISSDDPDAPALIRARIEELKGRGKSAEIRRLSARLEQIERRLSHTGGVINYNDGTTLEADPQGNRIRLKLPLRPTRERTQELRANGLRWAPSLGAWSGYYSALDKARRLLARWELKPKQ